MKHRIKMASGSTKCVFNKSWLLKYLWLGDCDDKKKGRCTYYSKTFNIGSMGEMAIKWHKNANKHVKNAASVRGTFSLGNQNQLYLLVTRPWTIFHQEDNLSPVSSLNPLRKPAREVLTILYMYQPHQ